jgi:hypothetical protein
MVRVAVAQTLSRDGQGRSRDGLSIDLDLMKHPSQAPFGGDRTRASGAHVPLWARLLERAYAFFERGDEEGAWSWLYACAWARSHVRS